MPETTPAATVAVAPTAMTPYLNASPISGFEGRFVCFEVTGAFREGMNTTFADGETILARETVLALMHSLGTSLGERERTEEFLSSVFGWD